MSALRWSSPNAFTNSLPPSVATAKYGVEPRASTLATSRRASGTPTRGEPVGDRVTGRTARRTTEQHDDRGTDDPPDEHAAHRVERHRAVTNRSNVNPITRTQPSRRQRRVNHGAEAVTIAAIAARPGTTREPRAGQPTERVGRGRRRWPPTRARCGRGGRRRRPRPPPRATRTSRYRMRSWSSVTTRRPPGTRSRRTRDPTMTTLTIHVGTASSPRNRSTAEFDERVAEQPLHEQREQQHDRGHGQPQHVGRRTDLSADGGRR